MQLPKFGMSTLSIIKKRLNEETNHFLTMRNYVLFFGKDRAHGNGGRSFGDIEEDENIGLEEVVEEFDTNVQVEENIDVQVDENTNVQVEDVSSIRSKKRKAPTDPLVAGLHEVVNVVGNTIHKAAATMSRDIDFQVDLKMKRAKITTEISKCNHLLKMRSTK